MALAVGVAVLGACSTRAADWNRYPGLRETVLLQAEEKDCQALTDTANLLRLDNEQAKARWGSDNGPLIREVERKASVAGCRPAG
jgi:hypothetical protein